MVLTLKLSPYYVLIKYIYMYSELDVNSDGQPGEKILNPKRTCKYKLKRNVQATRNQKENNFNVLYQNDHIKCRTID